MKDSGLLMVVVVTCACCMSRPTSKDMSIRSIRNSEGSGEPSSTEVSRAGETEGHNRCRDDLFQGAIKDMISDVGTYILNACVRNEMDYGEYGKSETCKGYNQGQAWKPVLDLIETGCDIDAQVCQYGEGKTMLYFAIIQGNHRAVNYLLENGATIKLKPRKCNPMIHGRKRYVGNPRTLLQLAARTGSLETVKLLIDHGADVKEDSHALHVAADEGQTAILKLFIEKGGDIEALNWHGENILHCAAKGSHLSTIEYLVELGIDPNSVSKFGKSVLYYVVEEQFAVGGPSLSYRATPEALEYLVSKGADISAISAEGETLLHQAANYCNVKMAKSLLMLGFKLNKQDYKTIAHAIVHSEANHPDFSDCRDTLKFIFESKPRSCGTAKDKARLIDRLVSMEMPSMARMLEKYCSN